jgi:hypothetical protein
MVCGLRTFWNLYKGRECQERFQHTTYAPHCTRCAKGRPGRPARCGGCGREYLLDWDCPRRSRYRHYCCHECYLLHRRRKGDAARHKACAVCGAAFDAPRSDAVTCSPKCRQKAYRLRAAGSTLSRDKEQHP